MGETMSNHTILRSGSHGLLWEAVAEKADPEKRHPHLALQKLLHHVRAVGTDGIAQAADAFCIFLVNVLLLSMSVTGNGRADQKCLESMAWQRYLASLQLLLFSFSP